MNKRTVYRWEAWGAVFIIIMGTLLHFVYDWSGKLVWVGLFVPVNESVWEHLKLGVIPSFVWGILELVFIGSRLRNFLVAKVLNLYTICLTIIGLFIFIQGY